MGGGGGRGRFRLDLKEKKALVYGVYVGTVERETWAVSVGRGDRGMTWHEMMGGNRIAAYERRWLYNNLFSFRPNKWWSPSDSLFCRLP